jgi:hypothetical protein
MAGTVLMLFLAGATEAGVARPEAGEFYVVTQECSTTIASLRPHGSLQTRIRPVEPPEVRRCSRSGQKVLCYAQLDIGGRFADEQLHDSDEYTVLSDVASILHVAKEASTADWMTVNASDRTAVTGVLGNENPSSLGAVASMVCRGVLATALDLEVLSKRR